MRNLLAALFVCLICLCSSAVSTAQTVSGYTDLDIDPDTGIVTATCETDADYFVAEYYKVIVSCTVIDSNNNIVASGGGTDDSGQGYVQAVVTFTGVPGETYTATSAHSLYEIYTIEYYDGEDPQPIFLGYDDAYDFGFYGNSPQTFEGVFGLQSPGPETATQSRKITAAKTVVALVFPNVPDHLSVVTDTTITLNCQSGTTLQRQVNYNVLDINQAIVSRQISVMETLYPPLVSSCTGNPVYTSFSCQPIATGNFTDTFSAGCPATPQLAASCGFTVPDQTWEWCSPIALPTSIGHIGQDLVYNNLISVGGNSAPMSPGTTFPK